MKRSLSFCCTAVCTYIGVCQQYDIHMCVCSILLWETGLRYRKNREHQNLCIDFTKSKIVKWLPWMFLKSTNDIHILLVCDKKVFQVSSKLQKLEKQIVKAMSVFWSLRMIPSLSPYTLSLYRVPLPGCAHRNLLG